jgi:toxin ParE1/3/4
VKVKLSHAAERDLDELRAYIAADNPAAADMVIGRLVKAFLLIRGNPEIGRPTPQPTIREWSVPGLPYLIPYEIQSGTLFILRIWHTSRDRPKSWQ